MGVRQIFERVAKQAKTVHESAPKLANWLLNGRKSAGNMHFAAVRGIDRVALDWRLDLLSLFQNPDAHPLLISQDPFEEKRAKILVGDHEVLTWSTMEFSLRADNPFGLRNTLCADPETTSYIVDPRT